MYERLEAELTDHLGRDSLYVPSNRLGLFLALMHWTRPGQRLLMSPLSADEILFLVLAAGLRPVIAPVCARSGNIDVTALAGLRFDAVLTTNLYGVPDDVLTLAARGITMIEDAAHALQTTVAWVPIGAHGTAGVLSLSKHAGAGAGGVLVMPRSDDRPELEALRERWMARVLPELGGVLKAVARNAVVGTWLARPAWQLAGTLGMREPRDGHRIELRRRVLASRLAGSPRPGLSVLDPWIRADNHRYRMRPGELAERYALRRLRVAEAQRERRLSGVRRLARLAPVAPAVLDHLDQPLFRVPLLVRRRDQAVEALRRVGVIVGHIYDPPFDDYAPGLVEPSPAPEAARWWARHVLPVDPLHADRAWPVLAALEPADDLSRSGGKTS